MQQADAEDIVGDVCLSLIRILERPKVVPSREETWLKPYVFRAVKNRTLRFLKRSSQLNRNVVEEATLDAIPDTHQDDAKDVEWVAEQIALLPTEERGAINRFELPHGSVTSEAAGDTRLRDRIYKQKSRTIAKVRLRLMQAAANRGVRIFPKHEGAVSRSLPLGA